LPLHHSLVDEAIFLLVLHNGVTDFLAQFVVPACGTKRHLRAGGAIRAAGGEKAISVATNGHEFGALYKGLSD